MFLKELNKKERENFLELANYVIKVDGEVSAVETNIFENYVAEMKLYKEEYKLKNKDIDEVIKEFNASTKKKKKIVLIELFGIILCNNDYHEEEKKLVEKIQKEWNFRDYEINKCKRWVEDFNDLLEEAYIFIGK